METEAEKQAQGIAEHAAELGAVLSADLNIHSFMHCRTCVERQQIERLEVGISRTGVVVQCKKHGIVVHYSPSELQRQVGRGPTCDCCPGGSHRS